MSRFLLYVHVAVAACKASPRLWLCGVCRQCLSSRDSSRGRYMRTYGPAPSSLLPRVFRSLLYAFTVRARAASIKIVRFATGRGLSSHIAHGSARGRYVRRTRRIDQIEPTATQRSAQTILGFTSLRDRRAEPSEARHVTPTAGRRARRPRAAAPAPGRIYSITLS